jgi:uncharacterized protein (DUF2141 family)/regulation of enolase protein 1 (concanavalin A-like superfamily)
VVGAGRDIWENADQFHFVYRQVQGNIDIVARVNSIQNTDPWSKAGIMIRQSLSPGSPHVSVLGTSANPWVFLFRQVAGGISFSTKGPNTSLPGWVKLTRVGDVINGYLSTDGVTWTLIDSETLALGTTVYVGLAVTSHNVNARATDTFSSVAVTTPTTNQPPTVSVVAPANGATYTAPASFVMTASASDPDGTIQEVELYQGSTLLKSDKSNPYSVAVNNLPAGSYQFHAVARDNGGATQTSAIASVTVNSASNQAPTVAISSPASGASYTAPANITIQATASDSDGTVSKVDFYQGSTLIGTDTSSPYAATWSSVPAGTYSLTARATDNGGSVRTSSAVSVAVTPASNQPPTVTVTSPTSGATYAAPASITINANASDTDGSVMGVDFLAGTQMIGTDTTSPYTASWNNVPPGSYSLTAVARDNANGTRTSAPVNVTVTGALPGPWTNADIGSPALSGSASSPSTGSFTVTGAGSDIWANADQFQFVYQPVQGDIQIVTRLASLQNTDPWSKGGIMIRQSLTAGSTHVSMVGTAANGWNFLWRPAADGVSFSTHGPAGAAPGWLKLTRVGNVITGYTSADGVTWTLLDSETITLGATAYVGLAVTSHNVGARATDTFTNVAVGPVQAGTNQLPTVSITSPASGATYTAPATVTINASASDPDGSIASVAFFAGAQPISTDTTSPFSASWTNVPAGSYSLTAVATDNAGGTRTSSAVNVTVTGTTQPTTLVFTASSDHATMVTSYVVAIYRAEDPLTAAPVATRDIGKPTPVNGDITVDITTMVNPLPSGSYKVSVRAAGPGGLSDPSTPSPNFTK